MGKCLEKLPHTCGTRQGLQVFAKEDGGVDGYCFACDTVVEHPYGAPKMAKDIPKPEKPSEEEVAELIREIEGYSRTFWCTGSPIGGRW